MNRSEKISQPSHDFDVVEGPVADDDITEKIDDYTHGYISKKQFLEMLKFKKTTHQICLCTHRSFQVIRKIKKNEIAYNLKEITKPILMYLVSEKGLDKIDAADKFYNSQTFTQLADKTTKFYEKDWKEIYRLLLDELNIK
jgi:hypothetical protein